MASECHWPGSGRGHGERGASMSGTARLRARAARRASARRAAAGSLRGWRTARGSGQSRFHPEGDSTSGPNLHGAINGVQLVASGEIGGYLRVCVAMLITEGNHYGSAQPGGRAPQRALLRWAGQSRGHCQGCEQMLPHLLPGPQRRPGCGINTEHFAGFLDAPGGDDPALGQATSRPGWCPDRFPAGGPAVPMRRAPGSGAGPRPPAGTHTVAGHPGTGPARGSGPPSRCGPGSG
jgi:hypothetical protein